MASHANITRRAALLGAVASSAALAVPAVAFIDSASPSSQVGIIAPLCALDRAKYHAEEARKAMAEHTGKEWAASVDVENEVVLVYRRPQWVWVPTDIPGLSTPSKQYGPA